MSNVGRSRLGINPADTTPLGTSITATDTVAEGFQKLINGQQAPDPNFPNGITTPSIAEYAAGAGISINSLINLSAGSAVAAAGNSQGTATLITKQLNTVTGADGTKGVKLPLVGDIIFIANDNSGILPVYPNTSQTIDGGGANASITLAANESRFFISLTATIWVSAQFLSKNWFVNTSGTFLPTADSTYDIGNGSVNPRDITASRNILTNTILEKTTDSGVTIETVLVKDGNVTMPEAGNVVAGTTTGTQIGTVGGASGQKLGVWGKTPIVQPVLATGAAHTADDIITVLQNIGWVRQS